MRIEDAGLGAEWFRNLTARVVRRPNRRGFVMFKRLLVKLARWLIGQGMVIARQEAVTIINDAAQRLLDYIDKSGGLQDPARINAYYRVKEEATRIADAVRSLKVKV